MLQDVCLGMTWGRCSSRAEERREEELRLSRAGFIKATSSHLHLLITRRSRLAWRGGWCPPWTPSSGRACSLACFSPSQVLHWLSFEWHITQLAGLHLNLLFSVLKEHYSDAIKISPRHPFWETSSDCSWLFIVNPQGQLLLGEVRVKASLPVTNPLLPVTVRLKFHYFTWYHQSIDEVTHPLQNLIISFRQRQSLHRWLCLVIFDLGCI